MLLVLLILVAMPLTLGAEQIKVKPGVNVDFGAGPVQQHAPRPVTPAPEDQEAIKKKLVEAAKLRLQHAIERHDGQREGFDCKMVKPVDPSFRSAMPVIEPPKHTRFPMKVIEAPPCRQSAR